MAGGSTVIVSLGQHLNAPWDTLIRSQDAPVHKPRRLPCLEFICMKKQPNPCSGPFQISLPSTVKVSTSQKRLQTWRFDSFSSSICPYRCSPRSCLNSGGKGAHEGGNNIYRMEALHSLIKLFDFRFQFSHSPFFPRMRLFQTPSHQEPKGPLNQFLSEAAWLSAQCS